MRAISALCAMTLVLGATSPAFAGGPNGEGAPAPTCSQQQTNRTVGGAVIGAILGGVVGSNVAAGHHRSDGTLAGAAAGGLAGGVIGHQTANCDPSAPNQNAGQVSGQSAGQYPAPSDAGKPDQSNPNAKPAGDPPK